MNSDRRKTIQKQIRLPLTNSIAMAWQSIRVRPGRSLLVMSGIVLAIAFLTNILCSDALDRHASRVTVAPGGADPPAAKELDPTELVTGDEAAPDAGSDFETRWMAGLALMIAFVGILNAMLLSVTERFHEIGTMKCLGALDSLIIRLFLLESLFQGGVGTLIGLILGTGLTLIEGWLAYGGALGSVIPAGDFLRIAGICALVGVGLTVLGALYPAWRAARMPPVVALRSEV